MARRKKQDASVYNVTVEVNGETYTAQGNDLFEAFGALGLDYTMVKTKGTITLEKGDKKSTKLYYLPQLRRIVASKLRKVQVAKDLEYLLK